jgi:PAS domain S-box-containing protein
MDWKYLAECSRDMLSVTDEQGRFVWLSSSWEAALGYPLEELTTRSVHDLMYEQSGEGAQARQELGRHTHRYRHRDGHPVWLEWDVTRGPDGLSYGAARDVTARLERERTQREQLALLEAVEVHARVGRYRVDLRTGESEWTPVISTLHGLAPDAGPLSLEESTGYLHPDDVDRVTELFGQAIEQGTPFSYEARLVGADGEVRWASTIGMVARAEDGTPAALYGLSRDVTEEKTRVERLMHTERLATIGQMAAGVAHEINNPLQFLSVSLELLEYGLGDRMSDDDERALAGARKGVDRVRLIVDGLRRFARSPCDGQARERPAALIEEAMAMTRGRFTAQVDVVLELAPDLEDVVVPEQALTQALLNLLVNACQAVEATGERGRVTVRAARHTQGARELVVVEVEDDGPGLPADAERIFEPFFTTKPSGEGTGLGLALARAQVSALGGALTVRDREGARGALATLTLPAEERDAQDPGGAAAPHERIRTRPRSILIVDDEPTITKALSLYLDARGWEVETANGGEQALEVVARRPGWAMILCDMRMPGLNGVGLRERLLAEHPECEPSLHFMTGDYWSDDHRDALAALGRPHLQKPFVMSELMGFLENHARRS